MFKDRLEAGAWLAEKLTAYRDRQNVIVLALPRGGVVVGHEIAGKLKAPLDVIIVRKIGHPLEPELAIGAVSETGSVFLNQDVISMYGIPDDYIQAQIAQQKEEIARRVMLYRGGKGLISLEGRIVLLVDDGVATGATMKAAIAALKQEKIVKLVVALPVAPMETAAELERVVDEFICLETPFDFRAVGVHYQNFAQVSDEDVIDLLHRSKAEAA